MFVDYFLENLFRVFFLKCKLEYSCFRGLKKLEITVESRNVLVLRVLRKNRNPFSKVYLKKNTRNEFIVC